VTLDSRFHRIYSTKEIQSVISSSFMSLHSIQRNHFIRFKKIPPTSQHPPPFFQNWSQLNRLFKNLRTVRFLNQISCVHSFRLSSSWFYNISLFYPRFNNISHAPVICLFPLSNETSTFCEQYAEFLNVKGCGICSYRIPFKG
jgi:hypothetical protein